MWASGVLLSLVFFAIELYNTNQRRIGGRRGQNAPHPADQQQNTIIPPPYRYIPPRWKVAGHVPKLSWYWPWYDQNWISCLQNQHQENLPYWNTIVSLTCCTWHIFNWNTCYQSSLVALVEINLNAIVKSPWLPVFSSVTLIHLKLHVSSKLYFMNAEFSSCIGASCLLQAFFCIRCLWRRAGAA